VRHFTRECGIYLLPNDLATYSIDPGVAGHMTVRREDAGSILVSDLFPKSAPYSLAAVGFVGS
jgi:hypothetical protein